MHDKQQQPSREQILDAIEANHWDYEDSYVHPGVVQVQEPGLLMRKIAGSNSTNANRVMRFAFSETEAEGQIQRVLDFFGDKAFAWWVGPQEQPSDLVPRLEARGFAVTDAYKGLAFPLDDWTPVRTDGATGSAFETVDVQTEAHVWEHVRVSADVWGMSEASAKAAFEERWHYLHLQGRRGGYVVTLQDGRGVGNASYRISRDGQTVYLSGSAVLPSHRKQGIYHELLYHRFQIAKAKGCTLATTQARVGHSDPILRKMGFVEHASYQVLTQS